MMCMQIPPAYDGHANATFACIATSGSLTFSLNWMSICFVIYEKELSTERDALRERLDLVSQCDRTREDWRLLFIRANQESVSCRGMDFSMVLQQIESLQRHFDNGTISRYQMMCAGLRTVIATPEDPLQETPVTRYRAPRARCNICNRWGIPYTVCLSCGEDSGGRHLWIFLVIVWQWPEVVERRIASSGGINELIKYKGNMRFFNRRDLHCFRPSCFCSLRKCSPCRPRHLRINVRSIMRPVRHNHTRYRTRKKVAGIFYRKNSRLDKLADLCRSSFTSTLPPLVEVFVHWTW